MLGTLVAAVNVVQSGLIYAIYGSYKTGFILVTFLKTIFECVSLVFENLCTIFMIFAESFTIFLQDILQYVHNIVNFVLSSFEILISNTSAVLTLICKTIAAGITILTIFYHGFWNGLWKIVTNLGQLFVIAKKLIVLLGSGIWFAVTLIPLLIIYFMKLSFTLLQELILEIYQIIVSSMWSVITATRNVIMFAIDVPIESLFGLIIFLSLAYILVQFYVLIHNYVMQIWLKLKSNVRRLRAGLFASVDEILFNHQNRFIYRRQIRQNIIQETPQNPGRSDQSMNRRNGPVTRLQRKKVSPNMNKTLLNVENTEDKFCVICQERNKCILLLPCRHVCLCNECNRELRFYNDVCPICRTDIESTMKIFV